MNNRSKFIKHTCFYPIFFLFVVGCAQKTTLNSTDQINDTNKTGWYELPINNSKRSSPHWKYYMRYEKGERQHLIVNPSKEYIEKNPERLFATVGCGENGYDVSLSAGDLLKFNNITKLIVDVKSNGQSIFTKGWQWYGAGNSIMVPYFLGDKFIAGVYDQRIQTEDLQAQVYKNLTGMQAKEKRKALLLEGIAYPEDVELKGGLLWQGKVDFSQIPGQLNAASKICSTISRGGLNSRPVNKVEFYQQPKVDIKFLKKPFDLKSPRQFELKFTDYAIPEFFFEKGRFPVYKNSTNSYAKHHAVN